MYVNYNGDLRRMGYPMPMPVYFFTSGNRKITPEQLKANLRRIVDRYVTVAVNENQKKTGTDHKDNNTLKTEVNNVVQTAINEVLTEITNAKIKVSPTASTGTGTNTKVFNLGSYVQDMNSEINQMINDGIPV